MEKIAIIGAGGLGREVHALIQNINDSQDQYEVLGFIDDAIDPGSVIHGLPVIGKVAEITPQEVPNLVIAIGNGQTRSQIFEVLKGRGFNFPVLIHPQVLLQIPEYISIGKGSILQANTVVTTDVIIGDFCLINLACTIGHDAEIGHFTSIMPGVNISGGAKIQDQVFIGTGAKLINASSIASKAIIGAGSVVNKDIPSGDTFVGVPARKLER